MQAYEEYNIHDDGKLELLLQHFENTFHDVKTPISIIYMHIQNIMQSPDLTDSMRKSAEIVTKYCMKIMRLLRDTSEYGRILQGRFVPKLANHDIIDIIRNLSQAVSALARKKEVELVLSIDTPKRFIRTDKSIIERVFLNVLSNAIKFTPRGGTISITVNCGNSFITIETADSGTGFKASDIPYVFGRYATFSADEVSGEGIGLSIVREMVYALGGNVAVRNGAVCGAVVTVELPADNGITVRDELEFQEDEYTDMMQTALFEEV